jgi:hypothetical protein
LAMNVWIRCEERAGALSSSSCQVLGLWYDDPAWPKLALDQWQSFRLVEGLPGRGSLSTDVRPSLKRLNHSFMREMLTASFPKACWILAENDAISLLKSFRHFATTDNPTSGHYTSSLIGRLSLTHTFCRSEKIRACTWMSPTQLHLWTHRSLHLFTREKLRFDTLWTPGYLIQYYSQLVFLDLSNGIF